MMFADGAWEGESRSEEEVMSVTSWRRSDKEIDAVPLATNIMVFMGRDT